jgi:CRISPR/Cas system-associated protein Cas5 (RAMP superfamily)
VKSLYDFIVKPIGDKYTNTIKVGDKNVIVNTKIENWKFVNRLAQVIETPLAFKSGIKKGDIVVIHQNVFRTFYDMKGKKKKSRSYFKNDLYFCGLDQVYLYKNKNGWNTVGDRCFITPIKSNDSLTLDKERKLIGILKYGNKSLEALEITPGSLVGYTPNSEWEFLVEGKRLYCMKSNDIVIKYEHQGNEEEYNPSWAASS